MKFRRFCHPLEKSIRCPCHTGDIPRRQITSLNITEANEPTDLPMPNSSYLCRLLLLRVNVGWCVREITADPKFDRLIV